MTAKKDVGWSSGGNVASYCMEKLSSKTESFQELSKDSNSA